MSLSDPKILFENDEHKFIMLGMETGDEHGIYTNQYLILHKDEGVLLDPGGVHVFPKVLANVSEFINPDKITGIFYSHQDPDVSSGIALWSNVTNAKIYASNLWERFLPHFGVFDEKKFIALSDKGGNIPFKDGLKLEIVPAHFMHSVGNFNIYDPISKIFFSGDVGVGVVPPSERSIFVESFESYKKYIEGFHVRYMTSNKACKKYVDLLNKYDINILAPQHGSLYKDNDVKKFLNWLSGIKCGVDIIDKIYGM
ncbi:MBL fold metallo-hydrolase [Tepiditoga spiralis]|uniref:MBL fold metallo-hydrolase n=1 Tax=Tepiditoga spiralis TaxID=2108365 RepID=A0A7G1G2Q6_9BACT|nr:MBL fold metallo-hydrolase [Tepiditoga spiralis]BBE30598.1 MBL fold metallo-hydrolase [Tepiditoga spiralis]